MGYLKKYLYGNKFIDKFNVVHLYRRTFWSRSYENIPFLKNLQTEKARLLPVAEKRIFVFWTGDNPMSDNRRRCLESLRKNSGVPVILITQDNLKEYVLPDHPLPSEFHFLSLVHKADYLRSYFMYHYGGGYCDVKSITGSWDYSFDLLNSSPKKSGLGYQEIKGGVAFIQPDSEFPASLVYNLNYDMRMHYKELIGNGAYIFKPKSLIFENLLKEQDRRLKKYGKELIKYPGNIMGDNVGYPLPWSYILGQIFHPIVFLRRNDLIQLNDVKPVFKNYR